jgi:hypothetical protein
LSLRKPITTLSKFLIKSEQESQFKPSSVSIVRVYWDFTSSVQREELSFQSPVQESVPEELLIKTRQIF